MKSINVKIWVGPCSGVCQKSEIAITKKAKAESPKNPSNVCCNSHKSLSNRTHTKRTTFYRKIGCDVKIVVKLKFIFLLL